MSIRSNEDHHTWYRIHGILWAHRNWGVHWEITVQLGRDRNHREHWIHLDSPCREDGKLELIQEILL